MNTSGDDAYVIFSGSRKTAIQVVKEPKPVGSAGGPGGRVTVDEGLIATGGSIQPPPPAGEQPKSSSSWPTVGYSPPNDGKVPFLQMSAPRLCQ